MRTPRSAVLLGSLIPLAVAARGEDVGSVQKKLQAAWQEQSSRTAKVRASKHLALGPASHDELSEGTVQFRRVAGKVQVRRELTVREVTKVGDKEQQVESRQLMIVDGPTTWLLVESSGKQTALKAKTERMLLDEPDAIFADMSAAGELSLVTDEAAAAGLADQTDDGVVRRPDPVGRETARPEAVVIEVKLKNPGPAEPVRALLYFDPQTGFLLKEAVYGAAGETQQTVAYTDVKYGEKLDGGQFEFKAPDGVSVHDLTAEPEESDAQPNAGARGLSQPGDTSPHSPSGDFGEHPEQRTAHLRYRT